MICYGLVGGEQHLLLLLQRLHLRQVPDELVELVLVVQDVLKSCSMKYKVYKYQKWFTKLIQNLQDTKSSKLRHLQLFAVHVLKAAEGGRIVRLASACNRIF